MLEKKRPGGEMSTRPLHFIWIADCSGSMGVDGKMQALNNAIREAIPHMRSVADENPNAEILVRAIKFSTGAQWHIGQPTKINDFTWTDLKPEGVTDLGKALCMVADELKIPPMSDRALPPVLVLLSDGYPTDNYMEGIDAILSQNWGKKAVKIAIAIGDDTDNSVLEKFIANPEIKPMQANNPETLVRYIKWVSTVVLKSTSSPNSQINKSQTKSNVAIPVPIASDIIEDSNDIW